MMYFVRLYQNLSFFIVGDLGYIHCVVLLILCKIFIQTKTTRDIHRVVGILCGCA